MSCRGPLGHLVALAEEVKKLQGSKLCLVRHERPLSDLAPQALCQMCACVCVCVKVFSGPLMRANKATTAQRLGLPFKGRHLGAAEHVPL